MNKPLLTPYLLIAATFVGVADTLFLSYYHLLGIVPGCAIGGCEIVLQSKYSMIGGSLGVPFAYIGVVFYVYMLALAILLTIEPHSWALRAATLVYSGIGLLASIGFELFQYYVIGALCLYCGISALTTLVLFVFALWHWRATRNPA